MNEKAGLGVQAILAIGFGAIVIIIAMGWKFFTSIFSRKSIPFLDKNEEKEMVLRTREIESHDTLRLGFSYGDGTQPLGLPVGNHILFFIDTPKGKEDGKWNNSENKDIEPGYVRRPYTPISHPHTIGMVHFVIKMYRPDENNPLFMDGGKMSHHLDRMQVGDKIRVKGPVGMKKYVGEGRIDLTTRTVQANNIALIAGGSGITPIFQIILYALESEKNKKTKFWVIFANKTQNDILMQNDLNALSEKYPDKLVVTHLIEHAPPEWQGPSGRINADICTQHLCKPKDSIVIVCGPPPFREALRDTILPQAGWQKESIVVY